MQMIQLKIKHYLILLCGSAFAHVASAQYSPVMEANEHEQWLTDIRRVCGTPSITVIPTIMDSIKAIERNQNTVAKPDPSFLIPEKYLVLDELRPFGTYRVRLGSVMVDKKDQCGLFQARYLNEFNQRAAKKYPLLNEAYMAAAWLQSLDYLSRYSELDTEKAQARTRRILVHKRYFGQDFPQYQTLEIRKYLDLAYARALMSEVADAHLSEQERLELVAQAQALLQDKHESMCTPFLADAEVALLYLDSSKQISSYLEYACADVRDIFNLGNVFVRLKDIKKSKAIGLRLRSNL